MTRTMSGDVTREPCPDRILDDFGCAFAMGVVGGSIFHYLKGSISSPRGSRFSGGLQTVRMNAPRLGGSFAAWGGIFSTSDCALVYLRQKEDPWNNIFAGAFTGGLLQFRQGPRAVAMSAAFGGVLLALMEGATIMVNKVATPPPSMFPPPEMDGCPPGGEIGSGQSQPIPAPMVSAEPAWTVSGLVGRLFGGGEEKSSGGGGSETKVLESFDSPTPVPTFEYK